MRFAQPGDDGRPELLIGSWPACPAQVLAKTWLVSSMAMSQRIPSHCPAMSPSVCAVAARIAGENAFSCTTSGHAGKYGSRPWASTRSPARSQPAAARMSDSSPLMNSPGWLLTQGWSGATWLGT